MRIQITTPLTSGGVFFPYAAVADGAHAERIAREHPNRFVPLADEPAPPAPRKAAPAVDAPRPSEEE